MPARFDPSVVEQGWHDFWEAERQNPPILDSGRRYSMIIPPPNITGVLHIGHALTVSVEDALVRWRRMSGDEVVWVPGKDHAGIATQTVVERNIWRNKKVSRHELGRDMFLAEVRKWSAQYGGRITDQLRRIGALLSWEREVFTLDAPRSDAVAECFVRLFERGLVNRRERLVNWCPYLQTALSDIEVDVDQLDGPTRLHLPGRDASVEVGWIDTFAYNVTRYPHGDHCYGDVAILVSTTRLETMLGDVAVAVHPDDARFSYLIGGKVRHPILGTELPIIADSILVDPTIGTGALKVTPAHDPNDFACAQRHGLPVMEILDSHGRVLPNARSTYTGQDRFAVRDKLRNDLASMGLYRGRERHAMALARCSRTGDILEPRLMPQWFVECGEMAERALQLVERGTVRLWPSSHAGVWRNWLTNIQDWCISRQLWWGHRIPAYRVVRDVCHEVLEPGFRWTMPGTRGAGWVDETGAEWIVARSKADAWAIASRMPVETAIRELVQDDDVLDTWFSSALLPISALGWPNRDSDGSSSDLAGDLKRYYPLSVMETGSDILFFWVARMMMICTEMVERVPFEQILLHPIVRDRLGRKMSKSLGNVIDPIAVIRGRSLDDMLEDLKGGNLPAQEIERAAESMKREFPRGIPECGSDALRFALGNYMQQGTKINLDIQRVEQSRFFCNKMWQAFRFAIPHLRPNAPSLQEEPLVSTTDRDLSRFPEGLGLSYHALPAPVKEIPLPCRWILSRLSQTAVNVNKGLATFDFSHATHSARAFFLHDLCDVFIEWSKAAFEDEDGAPAAAYRATLGICLDASMRLMHPFMPFVTEELWQYLQQCGTETAPRSILHAPFPVAVRDPTVAWKEPDRFLDDLVSPSEASLLHCADLSDESQMQQLIEMSTAIRSVLETARTVLGKQGKPSHIFLACVDDDQVELVEQHRPELEKVLRLSGTRLEVGTSDLHPAGCLGKAFAGRGRVFVHLERNDAVLGNLQREIDKWAKREKKQRNIIDRIRERQSRPSYHRTPAEIQAQDDKQLEDALAAAAAADQSRAELLRVQRDLS